MDFVRESINDTTIDIDEWFSKYVGKNSKLYQKYKSHGNTTGNAELYIISYYQIWLNLLRNSDIKIKTNCLNTRTKVYADGKPIAIIVNNKYTDIPFQGITIINKEYLKQFY